MHQEATSLGSRLLSIHMGDRRRLSIHMGGMRRSSIRMGDRRRSSIRMRDRRRINLGDRRGLSINVTLASRVDEIENSIDIGQNEESPISVSD